MAAAQQGQESGAVRPYVVRLAEPELIALAGAPAEALVAEARQQQRDELAALLAEMAASGLVGDYRFDEGEDAFLAGLSDAALARLALHPLVASVEPAAEAGPSATAAPEEETLPPVTAEPNAEQDALSIVFVQVYSPFMWGRTRMGGLSVELTLEDEERNVKGVAYQTAQGGPVVIDRAQLYFETVFVDPADPAHAPVTIVPGDRVRVVTSGIDPVTKQPVREDKRVVVDDVRAWTSYERDWVRGTAPAGGSLVVTAGPRDRLSLTQYLTPGSGMTYRELTVGESGSFSVEAFRTTGDETLRRVDLRQGSTGFVRLRHPDGSEVYTVHGQNVLVLENSSVFHGYAFALPIAPPLLEYGVTVPRPAPRLNVTLKDPKGGVKATVAQPASSVPYAVGFSTATIGGGDTVEVSINGAPPIRVATAPLDARVDLAANQVTGSGPANTKMVVGAGRVAGYITQSSYVDFLVQRVSTDGGGNFASGQFQCGSTSALQLRPGSFGYAGYEDGRGNFIYMAFAAPATHVMVDFPFLEGWIATGALRPQITLRAAGGSLKHQGTADPLLLWLLTHRLFINTYYHTYTAEYIVPGDRVTVAAGSRTDTIPVDRFSAYIDTDSDAVTGEAPAGAQIRVVPANDRWARREVVAPRDGRYTAGNPFTYFSSYNCGETTKVEDFRPGDGGRAYLQRPDGNALVAPFGRAMHVNQNENYVELYLYVTRGLDWDPVPQREATVTLAPRQGAPVTARATSEYGLAGKTRVYITDSEGQKVLIRAGDSLTVSFDEGPAELTRPVTLTLSSMALVTGSPDVGASTLAGVGPRDWSGQATLTPPPYARPVTIPARGSTAYAPLQFLDSAGNPVPLVRGYSGIVSFTNRAAQRIWSAWAATTYPVKITGWLAPGDTRVCGTAAPGSPVQIHDATSDGASIVIGSGDADAEGDFCARVSPALFRYQVVMAEAAGTFSQPVVVDYPPPDVQLSAAAYAVREGAGTATITVTLSAAAVQTVTVQYATSDGTARGGSDYTPAAGTLTFAPGQNRGAFGVAIGDDALDEPDETLAVALSNPTNAILGARTSATLTIRDDDWALGVAPRLWLPLLRRR